MLSESTSEKNEQSSASFVENGGLLNFPHKLLKIMNECDTDVIQWNNEGRSILLDHIKFQEQYLQCKNSLFRTKKMASFRRQLYLYGFHRVKSYNKNLLCNLRNPNVREYVNDRFQRGREDLLSNVCRKNTTGSKIKFQGKQIKMELLKEQTSGKRKAGPWLIACRLALKEALGKAVHQYQTERCRLEKEHHLANNAKTSSQDVGKLENCMLVNKMASCLLYQILQIVSKIKITKNPICQAHQRTAMTSRHKKHNSNDCFIIVICSHLKQLIKCFMAVQKKLMQVPQKDEYVRY